MKNNSLSGIFVLVLLGSALGIAYNALHPKPLPWKTIPKTMIELDSLGTDTGEDALNGNNSGITASAPDGGSTPPAKDLYADIPGAQFPIQVSLAKAKAFYDRGGLRVLDAREEHEFAEGHIAGAEAAPYDLMVADIDWLESTAADPRPILVYCGGGDCELSLNLGFELCQNGHAKVLVLKDGFPDWETAGYPVEHGEHP